MADELPQTIPGALATALNPTIGNSLFDKVWPLVTGLLVPLWASLLGAGILPDAKWVTFVTLALGTVAGFLVRHAAAPPTK